MGSNVDLWKEVVDWAVAKDIDGFGLNKDLIVIKDKQNHIKQTNTMYIEDAHAHGMQVHPYAFRNEYQHLAFDYGQDPYAEHALFLNLGIDGYFTDFANTTRQFLNWKVSSSSGGSSCGVTCSYLLGCILLLNLLLPHA